ncbi:MAG: ribose 5-phosphate isomerase B [Thermoanaerobaculia bacterium]|nr:ribose 5-phosphate isomerase B [Thermoanaerobaculia bacterium]
MAPDNPTHSAGSTIAAEEIRDLVRRVVEGFVDSGSSSQTGTLVESERTPTSDARIALGADHGGYRLKEALERRLRDAGYEVLDCGTHSEDPVDYPDIALAVAEKVADGSCGSGILVDGAGIGSAMAANKVPGVRAALCYDLSSARNSREHNHANVLTLGAGLIGDGLAWQIVETWLATAWGPDRHARRVERIRAIEERYAKTECGCHGH